MLRNSLEDYVKIYRFRYMHHIWIKHIFQESRFLQNPYMFLMGPTKYCIHVLHFAPLTSHQSPGLAIYLVKFQGGWSK